MATITADYNPQTGEVTYEGEPMTLQEWRTETQSNYLNYIRQLNEERDITSDIINLPGDKPYFFDTWFGVLPPHQPGTGYTFEIEETL